MLEISTEAPKVPLTEALKALDLDVLVRYAETSVRHVSRRWSVNPFVVRNCQMADVSQMLRTFLIERVFRKFDLSRYAGKPDQEIQRIFARFVTRSCENRMRDFAKQFTRNPDRAAVDAAISFSELGDRRQGFRDLGDGSRMGPDRVLLDSIARGGEEPASQVEVDMLLAKVATSLSGDAHTIVRMRLEGYSADEIAAETGMTAGKIKSLLVGTIRPFVAEVLEFDTAAASRRRSLVN